MKDRERYIYIMNTSINQGLDYLHKSAIGSHGNLKSSCCLVDARWVLKISGVGHEALRPENNICDDEGNYERYKGKRYCCMVGSIL